jgi:hypothetical protein
MGQKEGEACIQPLSLTYRRVYTPLQRQQTKWTVFGVAVVFLIEVTYTVIGSVVPGLSAPDSPYQLLANFTSLAFVAIPLTLGIAILRYRLWDIDTVVNRVLVYGLLTALLAMVYAGLIIGLESLAGLVAGSAAQQPLALVISTLVVAGLFLPVRRRIQSVIDRRFYRRKYDAQKMLAAFSDTLCQQVDLLQLSEQVLALVQETLQPEQVWLWLRESQGQPQNPAPVLEPVGQVRTTSSENNQSGLAQLASKSTLNWRFSYELPSQPALFCVDPWGDRPHRIWLLWDSAAV